MNKPSRKELLRAYKEQKQTGGVYVIRNTVTGRVLLQSAANLAGAGHRFGFAQGTHSCVHRALAADWKTYGAAAFAFEILETLVQGDAQTNESFLEDLKTLKAIWDEKLGETPRY